MAYDLTGKTALVTGGGSGMGRTTSLAYARSGARVVVVDINVEGGEETIQLIKEAGGEAILVHADVSKSEDTQAMVAQAVEAFGSLDCAFNNAAVPGSLDRLLTADYKEDVWDRVIRVNLKGVWLCMKAEIPQMVKQGGGAIVNTASVASLLGFPGTIAYIAAKHGVAGLTKGTALEYARSGVRVNAISPYHTHTPMLGQVLGGDKGLEQQVASDNPMGRVGEPQDMANAVLWLSSDDSSFVTGHNIPADGGFTAGQGSYAVPNKE